MRYAQKSCLILIVLMFWPGMARAEVLDRIVANVNGSIILYSELQDRIHTLEKMSPEMKTDDPSRKAQIEREVLKQMIRDRLTLDEVKRLKITVSDHDVDAAIEGIKKENRLTDAQLEHVFKQEGKTLAQFREEMKKQLERTRLLDRVLKSKIVITEAQIDAALQSGKPEQAERRRLAVIFIPTSGDAGDKAAGDSEKQANEVLQLLKGGADFAKVAREYSKGPAAKDGGDVGYIALPELAPAIEGAVAGLKENEMTDLVKGSDGYYILKVLSIQKEEQSATDAAVRDKVRRRLFQQELNRRFEEWVQDLESRAFIEISL